MGVPTPPTKSPSSQSSMADPSETRDSCYFPGCRKDTNCSCEICLASLNATLDLMPSSTHRSSVMTRMISSATPRPRTSPLRIFDPTIVAPSTPPHLLQSTAKSRSPAKEEQQESQKIAGKGNGREKSSCVSRLGHLMLFLLGSAMSVAFLGVFRPELSVDKVRKIGEESASAGDLDAQIGYVEKNVRGFLGDGKVYNCSSIDSIWKLNRDGKLVMHSRCILYKSMAEELSIWGWPLQTAGLLTATFASKSYTVLSGRATEWSEGKIRFTTHRSNNSWIQQKWSSSLLRLDPNTWILEYHQSMFLQRPMEFLQFRYMLKKALSYFCYCFCDNNCNVDNDERMGDIRYNAT